MTDFRDKSKATPRTDAKAGFANFDDAMKGGPGNVVPADFARELERELADALSGTDSLTTNRLTVKKPGKRLQFTTRG